MATSPLQLPENTLDMKGVSVATALPLPGDDRAGTIYTPEAFAACQPVYITPVEKDDYLLVYSRSWKYGQTSSGHPGDYTSYEISTTPGWVLFNSVHGTLMSPPGDIPMNTPYDTATLIGATALPPYYIYLLYSLTWGNLSINMVQHMLYNPTMKTWSILAEEAVPDGFIFDCPADIIYNIGENLSVILTPDILARIFTRDITWWDHPDILALNLGVGIPTQPILVFYPIGITAPTNAIQTYLAAEAPTNWTLGTSGRWLPTTGYASNNVATAVKATLGAISFVSSGSVTDQPIATIDNAVKFNKGLYIDGKNIIFFGSTQSGQVCQARKPWGRIGSVSDWYFFDGRGWSTSHTAIGPIKTSTGASMTTAGPISAAIYKDRVRLATTVANGAARQAQVYTWTSNGDWRATGDPISLGTTANGSYQGGTLQFQPQIAALDTMVNYPDAVAALPYCVTTKKFIPGASALDVTWGLWQLARLY